VVELEFGFWFDSSRRGGLFGRGRLSWDRGGVDWQLEFGDSVRIRSSSGKRLFRDRKLFGGDRLCGNLGRNRGRRGLRGRRLDGGLGGMRVFEHRGPLVGEVNLFLNVPGTRGGAHVDGLSGSRFCDVGLLRFEDWFFDHWLGLGGSFHRRDFGDGRRWRFLMSRGAGSQFRIGEAGGALESAA
jgi:hypothetical protein